MQPVVRQLPFENVILTYGSNGGDEGGELLVELREVGYAALDTADYQSMPAVVGELAWCGATSESNSVLASLSGRRIALVMEPDDYTAHGLVASLVEIIQSMLPEGFKWEGELPPLEEPK